MEFIISENIKAALPVLFVALLGLSLKRRYSRSIRHIKGPWLASVSAIWQVWHVAKGDLEYAVRREHAKHGDFVRISHKEVSCSHPDSIIAILEPPHHKAEWYQSLAVPDKYHQTPMSECDPKRHRQRSSITANSYSLSYLIRLEKRVDNCIKELREKLQGMADTGEAFHLDQWLNYVAFDIIGELTFSKRFGFTQKGQDIDQSISNMRFLMIYQAIMGYVYWLHPFILHSPLAGLFGLKPHAHIFNTVSTAVRDRSNNPDAEGDMVSQWITKQRKWPDRMEEHEILAVSGMTAIAGSETMTAALANVFYFLMKYPECMVKLQKELKQAQLKGQLSEIVQHDEAKRLPYLQACIKESLRYFAPVPFNLPRVAPEEGVSIGGHHFKQGIILSVNPFVIQRDPRYFGHDAEVFNPDRWLGPNSAQLDKYLITFGTGYNGCPGKQFAFSEMGKVAATLMRDFEFKLENPSKEWKHRSHFTVAQEDWPVRISQTSY